MILWDNILAFLSQNFNRNQRRQGHIGWYQEKQFAGCTPELFRRPGSNLEGSAPHPKGFVSPFLLLIAPLPPPTDYVQPSLQCTHRLGFKPAAVLSGCRCLVPRAQPGWQGSPRRCRDGRCRSSASAGSEMPRPSPGRHRMLGPMCTRKRRGVVCCRQGEPTSGVLHWIASQQLFR